MGRAGIVGGKTAETLPPADFVLSGAIEDVGREYEAGRPWKVRLDLTLRLRGHRGQLRQTFRSDAIEAAANELMPKIEEFRRQPASQSAVPEKELWRRQAMYLMPRRCETWAEAIVPNFSVSTASIRLETIRAWENVLVLDGNDWEAMTNLGICLIGFDRWYRGNAAAAAKCVAGSQLVERALRSKPSDVLADTFIACIGPMRDMAPARAREMAQYVVDHGKEFKHADSFWVKSALVTPASTGGSQDLLREKWDRAIRNAAKDPDTVLVAYLQGLARELALGRDASLLTPHLDSVDPVIQFVVRATLGEVLCKNMRDPKGLEHFDKAIRVLNEARAPVNPTTKII